MKWLVCAWAVVASSTAWAGDLSVKRFESDPSQGRSGAVRVEHGDLIYSRQLTAPTVPELIRQTDDLLGRAGLKLDDVIKLNIYLADEKSRDEVIAALKGRFRDDSLPAISWVATGLPEDKKDEKKDEKEKDSPGDGKQSETSKRKATVGLDVVAVRAASTQSLVMPAAVDGQRPLAVIPASATSRVFVSGQAEKGDGTVSDATKQTMASLFKTLAFLELSPADVVQVKGFLKPMSESAEAIKSIREAFGRAAAPPIILVEWDSPSLPIEIELIAATRIPLRETRPVVEYLTPPDMKASPVYSRIARVQSPVTIFLSGLYGTQSDPDSEAELRELFAQTKSLAEAAGSDMKHLLKATYYVSSKGSSDQHNKLRPEYYDPARPPAASKAIVKGVGQKGRTITWDVIAAPKE